MVPIFHYLSELYKTDNGWTVDRQLNDIDKIRPKFSQTNLTDKAKQEQVNKFALLESLFGVRMRALPEEVQSESEIYNKLHSSYVGLLYPFRVHCK